MTLIAVLNILRYIGVLLLEFECTNNSKRTELYIYAVLIQKLIFKNKFFLF